MNVSVDANLTVTHFAVELKCMRYPEVGEYPAPDDVSGDEVAVAHPPPRNYVAVFDSADQLGGGWCHTRPLGVSKRGKS